MPPRKQKHYLREAGLVLRGFPSGDHDLVLHVLLEQSGKKGFFLQGARKNRKKFPSLPELFEQGTFEYSSSQGELLRLAAYFPGKSHRILREELDHFLCAGFAFECLDLLIHDSSSEDAALFYQNARDFLLSLEATQEKKILLRDVYFFVVELLTHSGYLDPSDFLQPSRNQFLRMIRMVEEHGSQQLKSKKQFQEFLDACLMRASGPSSYAV